MVHLTNDAVQKRGEGYGKFEKGNKVSYEEFSKMFTEFKNNVINLLSAINKYRGNLLSEIENNMLDLLDYKRN